MLVVLGLGLAIALVPMGPARACSCAAAPDPVTIITLDITDSAVADAKNPFGGDDSGDFGRTVDLRGASLTVVGDTPELLADLEIDQVPVLAAVLEDPNMQDSCGTPHRPDPGVDLEVSGVAMAEGGQTFVYTGPCSGSFEVTAAAEPGAVPTAKRSPLVPVAVGVGGLLVVGLVVGGAFWQPRRDR